MAGLIALLLIGLVAAWALVVIGTVRALTRPARRTYATALARGRPGDPSELRPAPRWRAWSFRSRGVDLPVWDIDGAAPEGAVVILSHGWGDSRVGGLSRVPALLAAASRLILWDMPGHGEAPGRCTLGLREHEDLLVLLDAARADRAVILFGWSLGAGVSLAAAARRNVRIAGVIAEAPYRLARTPACNVLRQAALPWRATLAPALAWIGVRASGLGAWRGFDRAGLARDYAGAVLVIHGERDGVCPIEDGRAIAKGTPAGECLVLPGAGHHGLWTDPATSEVCAAAVRVFAAKCVGNAGFRSSPEHAASGALASDAARL